SQQSQEKCCMNNKENDGPDTQQRRIVIESGAQRELKEFSESGLDQFLVDLENLSWDLPTGLTISPFGAVAPGVFELKKNGSPAYRLVFAKFPGELVVLAARSKTSNGNDRTLVGVSKKRLKAYKQK